MVHIMVHIMEVAIVGLETYPERLKEDKKKKN